MRITDEQKERANLVNLPQFLMAHGFDLKKVGREYVWKEHDSLHIKDNEPGERGGWYRFSEHKGGDNIGFLREYMGMSFVEAVEALNGEHYDRTYTPSRTYEPKPVQKTARELSLAEADNARRVFAYLCKTRGLDYDMVSALVRSGVIAQEEKTGNVLFKYYDVQGKVIGAEKVGTSTEHKFKGIATGSAGGHGFEVVRGSGEKAYFFESAIDMLSYLQMHDQELDNCRLVSMMGVKPNIVLDTMLRHNIPPENVVLCSDNDTAGNEFAQRLQEQYPQMERTATPDTYKDWNDMLRGIPKETEQKKEADKTDMQLYGNKMWNDATDNRDKSLVTVSVYDFPKVQEQLERAGMNYYGYVNGNSVVMAINDKDVALFGRIVGAPNITPRKSNRPYSPPEKNIIGNAEYRYIPQKQYVSADRDLILKMAELMQNEGISFSGRIYPTGKGTLTVSNDELWKVRDIQKRIIGMRKQFATADKAQEVGNRGYRQNRDTHHYMSKLTPEQFKEIKPFLETSVSYHAIARDGKVAFAVDKDNAPAFHRALENAVREVNMLHNMTDLGLPMEQMIALSPVIHRLAVEDVKLNLADFFDRRYDEAQFGEMLSLVNAYLAQAPAERYGENSKLSEMLEAKSSFDRSIELADFFSQHDFSDEQRAAITAMFVGDVTRGQLDSIDETFTVEDIQAYDEILHNALQESDVADFLTAHKQTVIDRENEANEPELTEKEQAFLNGNIDSFLAKAALSVEEMAEIGYRLYEAGYIDRTAPSESSIFGNGLSDADLHDMARRMQNGEDICKELACAVLGEQSSFITRQGNEFSVEYGENSLVAKYGNAEREISYESIGDEMLSLIENEYRQAVIDRENAAKKQAEEKLFEQADLAMFIAEHTLSSDEWESMAYPLFEKGYLDKHKPDDKGILGYHLSEPAFYDLAYRHQSGEDIRKELALGLMEHSKTDDIDFVFEDGNISTRTYLYNSDLVHTLHAEFGEDSVKLSFGNAEREITYAEIGQAFLDRTFEEFNDLAFWWVRDDMREAIPDISDERIADLISAFDGAAMADWEKGDNLPKLNRIKKALFDILGDKEQTEKAFACIAKNKYNVSFEPEKQPDSLEFQFGYSHDGNDHWFTESGLLSDFVEEHNEISFALANALMEYLDDKQHQERMIPELKAGYYKKTNIEIRAVVDGQNFTFADRFDIGDGKGTGGGSLIDHIRTICQNAIESTNYPYNTPESKETPRNMLNILVPFLEAHSELTAEEQKILDDFKEQYPIRTLDDVEQEQPVVESIEFIGEREKFEAVKIAAQNDSFGTTIADGDKLSIVINVDADINDVRRLIETAQENGAYLTAYSVNILEDRFGADFMQAEHKPTVADLAVGDIIMYEGSRREVESISDHSISLKDLDAPDFGGVLLGTSDVLAYDGWQQDMESKGFEILSKAEKSEPTIKAPEVKKVHQVITNAGFDGGIDDKMEYATVDEAVKAGRDYLADGYLGFSVYNQETKQIEHTEGDFPLTHAFNADILKLNGINEPEYKGYVTMAKVGDFYEMHGKNAEIGAEVLGLRILSKHGEPMVGFPDHDKDEYSKKLGEAGYSVLIEQAFELNPPKQDRENTLGVETSENLLDKAKALIGEFCMDEYGSFADFSDLHNVNIAYTTLTDDELPIQVTADLIDCKISYEFDGEIFSIEQFENIEEMIDDALYSLSFDELVSVPDEVLDRHIKKEEHTDLTSDASEVAADIDAPLFTDASVIEEIQRNENDDIPFWQKPDTQGEQLSLFGDPEPLTVSNPEKPKSEFSPGPVVDGVQVYEALAAEIDRGTGFVNGKLRVQDFYEEQHPTLQQLADFLKKEYGTSGHSGNGNISFVDYDSKGLTFSFENGEKFRHSWYNVAVMTEARLKDNTYLSAEQQAERQAQKEDKSVQSDSKQEHSENKSCVVHSASQDLDIKFTLKDSHSITIQQGDRDKTVPVEDSDEFTFKVLKTKIKAKGGAEGLFDFLEKIANDPDGFMSAYARQIASAYLGEPKEQKQEISGEATMADNSTLNPLDSKSAIETDLPVVKNLSQLKKALKPGMEFVITDHSRPESVDERRQVSKVDSTGFYSHKVDENGEQAGKDLFMAWDRAKNWSFDGSEMTSHLEDGSVLMSFHFVDSSERTKEPEREPFSEEIAGADDTIIYRITENADDQYKYNVQILTQGENGEFAYSGNGKFCETLDDAHAFVEQDIADRKENADIEQSVPDKSENFTITDDALGEGGAKAKFRANIEAIRTLKTLEAEKRPATAEEKETLSKYVGWGALSKAFDKSDDKWSAEYQELLELLTPEEYRQARASVGDAFYTSPTIIDGIYEALRNFGFHGGSVLEPAMGVGNFFGRMPEEMQASSQLYGVEIDSISGRIAQALYPDADIAIQGFEKNRFQNGCFDVAVGNVPFGDLAFVDAKHGTSKLHDYFFLEALDKLKNGGIMAFVTSVGTLDKRDEATRQMLADKADFIGAIRLPGGKNGAFRDNAGTEVTTDIIFLQKREGKSVAEMSDIPDWVHIGETADGLPINQYFADHPDMVLGTVIEGNKLYGSGTMVVAEDGFDLKAALNEAVSKLSADISPERGRDVYAKTADGVQVQIPSNLRNYSFFMSDDQVFFKKNNAACEFRFDKGTAQHKRFKAFIELRDLTRELLEAQELDKPDSVIKDLQAKLNAAYDDFYEKYGLIHSQTNKRYFSEDVSYNLVAGLEKSYDKNKLKEKSDIFFKRTIVPPKAVDHVETALEALTLSIAEKAKVDFEYMSSLTGMTEDELKHDLTGEIFRVPHTENDYQTASEYLSGDIRAKLREAEEIAEYDADFNINVSALKAAMPEPLKAGDIDVKIGATWLDPKYYEQFIYELLQTPEYQRSTSPAAAWNKSAIIGVEYSEHTNSFHVSNKSSDKSVLATQKYGSHKMNAYDIFEHILNLQEPKVYMTVEVPDGYGDTKEKRVVDIDATRVVQRKADDMRKAFKNWIFKDPERREAIVQRYNELFNSIRPREYDGSALSFPMMTSDIQLHDHQKNAIAHAMFGGNTLFAHSVGAGKTYEMIATAMESKRLGLCTKSLFAVPNHLTEQIGDDFQKLYPSANILVATKKDFKKENRQQLFAKIATGNYDAVIIGHSQLGMIPVSRERQVMTIQSQIDDILQGIEELKRNEGSKFQIKAMERTRKSLQKQLDRLEKTNQDDTLTFEQLGVDKLFIDEAHEFKNLFVSTKLNNVAGISSSASQKALDLFLKCRYLDEKTGGRGIVFATGTPLSNSITELHTMMRYLEYDFLRDHGLQHFDGWVSVFGEQKTDWELKPAGNGFKERTRIAQYSGLPELMSMFKQIADIRTADTLKLDVPDCDYQVVQVEATPFQQELVQELADRADAINSGNVDPSIDNMLKITSDGRKLGLDPRLIDPSFEDNPETKLNKCVENVARIHAETAEDRLTQIIFCDLGVPHKSSADAEVEGDDAEQSEDNKSAAERESLEEECDFCVYDDIRDKLIAKGIPAEEIAYIHDAKTEKQKADLFDKVRSGEIRVLLGSTAKMGTGTNVQKKLIAVHDLDIPWRPADLEQRAGRIIRQGNENKNVQIFRYVTKGTFDAYSYQTLENKQRFISQIMTSKTPARKCEDVDQQALTYSEIKALCTGDERVKEKLMLENDVKELRALAAEHRNTVYEMEDKIKRFPEQEQRLMSILDDLHSDREALRKLKFDPETKLPVFKITIDGKEYTDKKEAAKAFETAALAIKYTDTPVKIGSFQGFDLTVTMNSNLMGGGMTACLKGAASHTTKLISSFAHNLNRLESALYNIDGRINGVKENLAKLRLDYAEAQKIVAESFPQQAELESKEERLKTVTDALNLAAIEAKKNAPKREKTCYFERAKMKKEAMRVSRQKPNPSKDKSKGKKKPNLE